MKNISFCRYLCYFDELSFCFVLKQCLFVIVFLVAF